MNRFDTLQCMVSCCMYFDSICEICPVNSKELFFVVSIKTIIMLMALVW